MQRRDSFVCLQSLDRWWREHKHNGLLPVDTDDSHRNILTCVYIYTTTYSKIGATVALN